MPAFVLSDQGGYGIDARYGFVRTGCESSNGCQFDRAPDSVKCGESPFCPSTDDCRADFDGADY